MVVVLNAQDHLGELRHAVHEARKGTGLGGEEMLEDGFASVVRHDLISELVVDPLEA